MPIVLLWLACACAFGGFGAWIAAEKGRRPATGAVIGALFGPIGVLVLALLPGTAPTPGAKGKAKAKRPAGAARNRLSGYQWEPERERTEADDDEDRAMRYLSGDN